MKELRLNKLIALRLPDGYTWWRDDSASLIRIETPDGVEALRAAALRPPPEVYSTPTSRLQWCHAALIEYLETEIGPPYSSSVEEITGDSWFGYQGVTALGNGLFTGTRLVIGKNQPAAVRFAFSLKREDVDIRNFTIIEELVIGPESP